VPCGPYEITVEGETIDTASSVWEAYGKACRARDEGAARVVVWMQGRRKNGPVFAIILEPKGDPAEERASNTTDPALWDAVLAAVIGKGK